MDLLTVYGLEEACSKHMRKVIDKTISASLLKARPGVYPSDNEARTQTMIHLVEWSRLQLREVDLAFCVKEKPSDSFGKSVKEVNDPMGWEVYQSDGCVS